MKTEVHKQLVLGIPLSKILERESARIGKRNLNIAAKQEDLIDVYRTHCL